MTTYGLTATGFVKKDFETVRGEINTDLQTAFGDSIGLTDSHILGQIVAIFAERVADLWDLGEAVNSSQDPDKATGAGLEALCALTGTTRDKAVASTVNLRLTGTPTTVVTAGAQGSVDLTGDVFATDADATIIAVPAWAATTAYVVGDIVYNSTLSQVYECVGAGTSSSTAPSSTSKTANITDGTVTWRFLGNGTGAVVAPATATETGPIIALSGTIINIETPISGWDDLNNIDDATIGAVVETDSALRIKRDDELAAAGTSPTDPVRTALLAVDGVTAVKLFVNNTDLTDGDGVPPHAIEALVLGGADQDIWDALLANVAAGIQTHGTESGTSVDSEGNSITMKFSRPTTIRTYVAITVTYDATLYPADGDTQIKSAIAAWSQKLATGQDVHDSAVSAQAFTILGLIDVTSAFVDTVASPINDPVVTVNSRELATINSADITVTSSPATP